MVRAALLMAVTTLLMACSTDSGVSPTRPFEPRVFPATVVDEWLDALEAGDLTAVAALTEPIPLVLLAAVENDYTVAQTAALVAGGLPEDLFAQYWTSFRDNFEDFRGLPFAALEVGTAQQFQVEGVPYSAVEITSGLGGGEIVVRSSGPDMWRVDMVATVGEAFAARMRRLAQNIEPDAEGDVVRSSLLDFGLPGLKLALLLDPDNSTLGAEIDRLESVLGGS